MTLASLGMDDESRNAAVVLFMLQVSTTPYFTTFCYMNKFFQHYLLPWKKFSFINTGLSLACWEGLISQPFWACHKKKAEKAVIRRPLFVDMTRVGGDKKWQRKAKSCNSSITFQAMQSSVALSSKALHLLCDFFTKWNKLLLLRTNTSSSLKYQWWAFSSFYCPHRILHDNRDGFIFCISRNVRGEQEIECKCLIFCVISIDELLLRRM